jgi:hypothetical protein
MADMAGRRE